MKLLKLTFADGAKYTLSTFTILETRVMKREHSKFENLQDEQNRIQFETDEDGRLKKDEQGEWIPREGLTDEEKERLEEIEDKSFVFMMDVLRKSLCRNHPEFKKVEDEEEDREVMEKIMDLVDMPDLRKIVQFAFSGTFVPDENIIDYSVEILGDEKKTNGSTGQEESKFPRIT
jgi:hypothetical protein